MHIIKRLIRIIQRRQASSKTSKTPVRKPLHSIEAAPPEMYATHRQDRIKEHWHL